MDQQTVIILSKKTGSPIGLVENPPILYSNFKLLFRPHIFSDTAVATEVEAHGYGIFEWAWEPTGLFYTRSFDDVGLKKHADGVWRPTFIERDATPEELTERTKTEALRQRSIRNEALMQTDYTQLEGWPLSEAKVMEYKVYRQALRDIPKQSGFPWIIEFPVLPKE